MSDVGTVAIALVALVLVGAIVLTVLYSEGERNQEDRRRLDE